MSGAAEMTISVQQKRRLSNLRRRLRYLYLRMMALRGSPRELALGMALGIFTGMMPILPFQIAVAVTLAFLLRASKITAVVGTWISNPMTWYAVYFYDYKLGAYLLGMSSDTRLFSSVMAAIEAGEAPMEIISRILGGGGMTLSAFLLGGLVLGVVFALPSYFIWFGIFDYIRARRLNRKRPRR